MSITNGTRMEDDSNAFKGTIVWSSFETRWNSTTDASIWVNGLGHVSLVSEEDGMALAMNSTFSG